MEPNEMERYTFLSGFLSCLPILVEHPTGEWVRYSDAMQIITALQAKIDGMIKRPKIGTVYRDSVYCITINGIECDMDDTPTTHYEGEELKARYRRALGMDDPKEGGAG